ncbi:hypothetical protein E1301_Tti009323 [Triplophysa tibetana]|uniref:Uncharacterized protein n=1 Tax=Triplophysa tibetana TaxID=1572043 RepID=A0A5A9NY16_9TELE|nr:hypothetical protein E1301_Tti009323 [Triplophysa tibetana]
MNGAAPNSITSLEQRTRPCSTGKDFVIDNMPITVLSSLHRVQNEKKHRRGPKTSPVEQENASMMQNDQVMYSMACRSVCRIMVFLFPLRSSRSAVPQCSSKLINVRREGEGGGETRRGARPQTMAHAHRESRSSALPRQTSEDKDIKPALQNNTDIRSNLPERRYRSNLPLPGALLRTVDLRSEMKSKQKRRKSVIRGVYARQSERRFESWSLHEESVANLRVRNNARLFPWLYSGPIHTHTLLQQRRHVAWPQTSCALAERYQTLSNNHIHSPMCLCVSLSFSSSVRADGLPEGAFHPAPPLHCRCVRSGLSPCELPSDPRLSMRELIMADGPRCKRRKQANPRRKNGKSRMGKCPGAERVKKRFLSPFPCALYVREVFHKFRALKRQEDPLPPEQMTAVGRPETHIFTRFLQHKDVPLHSASDALLGQIDYIISDVCEFHVQRRGYLFPTVQNRLDVSVHQSQDFPSRYLHQIKSVKLREVDSKERDSSRERQSQMNRREGSGGERILGGETLSRSFTRFQHVDLRPTPVDQRRSLLHSSPVSTPSSV